MEVTRVVSVAWATPEQDLYYRVVDDLNQDLIARTNVGVTEFPEASGLYHVRITTWDLAWLNAKVIWDDGTDYALGLVEPVQLFPVDGVSEELFRIIMLAFAVNLNDITDISVTNRRVDFKLRDGTTTVCQVNYNPDTGERSISIITPPA